MNHHNRIKLAFQQLVNLNLEQWAEFERHLEEVTFQKNEFLCQAGQVEQYLYFIHAGAVRVYHQTNQQEFTLNFHFADEFVSAFSSFLTQTPSRVYLQALENVQASRIHRQYLYQSYEKHHQAERIGRLFAETLFIHKTNREIDLLSLSAEEQYLKLLQKNPQMVNTISVKHLASYLGIQPESLSRIRHKISRNS
ncbi:Crp/Fnr family transcriptional regulator [Adhaeribacter radiodurans]|uniref:Crp/Fnr family transcriptional regulator n=1 Tax=Adhaeribacter radiodurans TaxID=2745197 RepID=A0A7L7LEL5_9BACT|nr:Crp/Fnr family transcriptional regulator [Adhaeribacter radiodurans]QMU31260.1 Crp/Fnr family transcriptional regulator [Adhaeribacter radiodurans]